MKLKDDLPRWVMWPLRSVFYALVLYIVFAIAQSVAGARLKANIEECIITSRVPGTNPALNRLARLHDCLDRTNGILENLATSPARKAIDALSNHPSEFVGIWNSSQPHCHYKYQLTESGEYLAEPVKCSISNKSYTGAWGIIDNQIVWLHDYSNFSPIELNPIEAATKDAFVLMENDGSRTQFSRIVENAPALAKSEPLAEEPVKQVPLPEGTTRLPFGSIAPHPGALAVSADGSTAAHVALNGDVQVWSPLDGKQLEVIPANGKQPGALAISEDGKLVAIGHFDSQVTVWSHVEREVKHQFKADSGAISALAFSLDGKLLAVGSDGATTQLREVASGRLLQVFDSMVNDDISGGTGIPVAIGFSGDGKALIVNEWYSRHYDVGRGTTIWDLVEGVEIATREVAPPNGDNGMRAGQALGGKGWLLAYTGNNGLMAERLDSCAPPVQFPTGGYAETVISDSQGRWVAAAEDEQLTFFAMTGDRKAHSVKLPGKAIAFAPLPDGQSVLALMIDEVRFNGNDHFIFGRDAETITKGALYRIAVPEPYWQLTSIAVKDGATRCPPSAEVRNPQDFKLPEKPAELTSIAKLVPTKEMTTDPDNPTGEYNQVNPPRELYFGKDSKLNALYLARSDLRSGAAEWDLNTQRPVRAWFKQYVGDNAFRLNDGWGIADDAVVSLLTGLRHSSISSKDSNGDHIGVVSDPDTGQLFRKAATHIERYGVDGSRLPDIKVAKGVVDFVVRNGKLAARYGNGVIRVWQLKPSGTTKDYKTNLGHSEDPVHGAEEANVLAMSTDGRYLQVVFPNASGDGPDVYSVYSLGLGASVGNGELLTPFPGRSNRGVVADSRRHRLAIWDFDKGKIIARPPRQPSRDQNGAVQPLRAALSDDGRRLAVGSYDGLIRVWDIDSRQLVGEARAGSEVISMAFDSAGQRLAAGITNGQILVFQVDPPQRGAQSN